MALPKLETPTYELVQPSTGKKIKYRPFLVKEHKVLLTMSQASDDEIARIIKELIDVCTFNQLKIDQLPHFDVEYIFMMLRAKSIGESVDVVVTCANCTKTYDASFNIEDIVVEKGDAVSNKVMITDSIGIQFKYPSFNNVMQIFNSDEIDSIFNMVKECMVGVEQGDQFFDVKDQTGEEINEFLESLSKEQFDKIEKFFVSSPKVVQKLETDCPHCKHHNFSRIQGLQNFFV